MLNGDGEPGNKSWNSQVTRKSSQSSLTNFNKRGMGDIGVSLRIRAEDLRDVGERRNNKLEGGNEKQEHHHASQA